MYICAIIVIAEEQIMSRLAIELTPEQHQKIKTLAAIRGKSIKDFVLEQIFPMQITDEEKTAWGELQTILTSRITKAESGAISNKNFDQITNEVIHESTKSV